MLNWAYLILQETAAKMMQIVKWTCITCKRAAGFAGSIISRSLNVTLKFLFECQVCLHSVAFVHYIACLMLVDVFYMNSLFLSVFSSVSSPYMWVIAPAKPRCWVETFGTLAERRVLLWYRAFLFNKLVFCFVFVNHTLSIWISQTLVCLCWTLF